MDSASNRSPDTRPATSDSRWVTSDRQRKGRGVRSLGLVLGLSIMLSACGDDSASENSSAIKTDASPSLEDMTPQDRVSYVIVERLKAEGNIDEACVYEFNSILSDYSAEEFYKELELDVQEPDEASQALLFASKSSCTPE